MKFHNKILVLSLVLFLFIIPVLNVAVYSKPMFNTVNTFKNVA